VEAERAVKDIAEGDDVHLYLGANRSATSHMLPELLLHFSRRCPDVRIRTELLPPDQLLERLSFGFLDAAIVEMAVDPERFHVTSLLKDEVVAIVRPDHPLAGKGTISLDELCREPLITNSLNSGTRQLLRARLDLVDKHDTDLNIVMELQNSELVKQMTDRLPGVGLVSRLVMSQSRVDTNLAILSIDDSPIYRVFNLVTTWKSQERQNVRNLCEIASQIYSEEMLFA